MLPRRRSAATAAPPPLTAATAAACPCSSLCKQQEQENNHLPCCSASRRQSARRNAGWAWAASDCCATRSSWRCVAAAVGPAFLVACCSIDSRQWQRHLCFCTQHPFPRPSLHPSQMKSLRKEVAELMRQGKQGNARIRCAGGRTGHHWGAACAQGSMALALPRRAHCAHLPCRPALLTCSVEAVMREHRMLQVRSTRLAGVPACLPAGATPWSSHHAGHGQSSAARRMCASGVCLKLPHGAPSEAAHADQIAHGAPRLFVPAGL